MNHRTYLRFLGLLAMLAVLSQGCDRETQSDTHTTGTRRLVWIDQSSSVSEQQRHAWRQEAEKVIALLVPGDTIAVFGVHEATLGATPLFIGDMPVLSQNAGLSERIMVYEKQHKIREQVRAVFAQALTSLATAQRTDLFGVLERIKPDGKDRTTRLYFFSDMQHVTAELNMEKTSLARNMPDLVQTVITRHGWQRSLLDRTTVHCVLPGVRGNREVNPRQVLERFWGMLFRSLGAELATFETYLPASDVLRTAHE
jgi:hypothetical protein